MEMRNRSFWEQANAVLPQQERKMGQREPTPSATLIGSQACYTVHPQDTPSQVDAFMKNTQDISAFGRD